MITSVTKAINLFKMKDLLNNGRQYLLSCILLLSFASAFSQPDPCDGMKCISYVNLSLDETCMSTISPGMFVQELNFPADDYTIEVRNAHGELEDLDFGLEDVGETFEVKVFLPACNNSCWSYMTVEYKLPPELDCPEDLTISCGGLDVLGLPGATAACGGLDFTVTLHNETRERLDCDPDYTHRIVRTYRATDEMGNFDECSHEILLERVDLNNIMFPENRSVATGNAISCGDPAYIFDENGIPLPWLYSSITGSGSGFTGSGTAGVPFICDPSITDGVFCPMTGSGNGAPLIPMGGATDITFEGEVVLVPGAVNQVCNSVILYTDLELPQAGCIKKVMRTWEVREWWCNGENTTGSVQLIEIIDDAAPTFSCPADMTITTNDYCAAAVEMPSVEAEDECGGGIIVAIDYPKGYLESNGGLVDLEVGDNLIHYIVSDSCYNSSSCSVNVTVRDNTEPVAICEQSTVVSISQSGTTLVFADSFDDGSWDECGLDRFEVRRMDSLCVASDTMFDASVSFCCVDSGDELMVVFRAYDLGGNYNDCMVRVEVQDKDIPAMTCPSDVTIDCRDAYDLNNLGLVFGELDVIDNCAAQQVVTEEVTADVNQCGIGEIVREFSLRSQDSIQVFRSCKQRIEIVNYTPFVASNIAWPMDYDTTGVCSYDIGPDELPELNAYPRFVAGDDACSLLGWDYEDRLFETRDGLGECAYIERTWSVINWCSEVNGSFEIFTIPQPQIIEIYNTEYPVIVAMPDTTIESFNIDCESGLFSLTRTATDDCDSLYWSYEVVDALQNVVTSGVGPTYTDTLVNGDYTINWLVSDLCGNIATDEQVVTVINKKAPIPICINGFSVSIQETEVNGQTVYEAELWASDFDGGSYHPCSNPITLSMSSDTMIKNVVFDCEDAGLETVQMWVTDRITGEQDFCMTTVQVLDHPDCPAMSGVNVSGEIYTEELEQISGVEVDLGGSELSDMTDTGGQYAFGDMPMGGDYAVVPRKDGDDLNGVSTLDIIMIQRHILGIEKLDSPYKYIAADIDRNDRITATDLIELRKLVLGIYNAYPDNDSWRFVDAEVNFNDPENPWAFEIPEKYEILNLNEDMIIDFVGVKIGDVNHTVNPSANFNDDQEHNNSAPLNLNTPLVSASIGEYRELAFTSENYNNIAGWQGTLEFDPAAVEVVSINGEALDLEHELNLNLTRKEEGLIAMSYSQAQTETFDGNQILFKVGFIANKELSNNKPFELGSTMTKAEAYGEGSRILPFNTKAEQEEALIISSVAPNPWVDNADVNFKLPVADNVRFEFFDVNGRLLYIKERYFQKGSNSMSVTRSQINSSGVIYARISTSYAQTQYKMLIIE